MKQITVYRIALWLLIACVLGMGAALKHAQHRADVLKEQLETERYNAKLREQYPDWYKDMPEHLDIHRAWVRRKDGTVTYDK